MERYKKLRKHPVIKLIYDKLYKKGITMDDYKEGGYEALLIYYAWVFIKKWASKGYKYKKGSIK